MRRPPPVLLAIDSGFPDLGAAVYADGVLVQAAWVKVPELVRVPCDACWPRPCEHQATPELANRLVNTLEDQLGISKLPDDSPLLPSVTLVEVPQVFGPESRGARPLFLLSAVAASVLRSAHLWGSKVYQFTPRDWKGMTAKNVHQAETLGKLSDEERARLPRNRNGVFRSDPLDAAALGLWWLCRAGARDLRLLAAPALFLSQVEAAAPRRKSPARFATGAARAVRCRPSSKKSS